MKRILLTITSVLLLVATLIASDKTLNVYRTNGQVDHFILDQVDSIRIDTLDLTMKVYRTDGTTSYIDITTVDSMNYSVDAASLPQVKLLSADYNYKTRKATCITEVLDDGGCDIYETGICWSRLPESTINDHRQVVGGAGGKHYATASNLGNGLKYYVRAYASNCMGTAYSDPVEVKTMSGNVTYTLDVDPVQYPEYYSLLTTALDSACYYYNAYTTFNANIYVYYNAGIPTAQANYHGSIGFGPNTGYMWVGTAMHEMAHFFGTGTTSEWQSRMVGGVWQGPTAQALCQQLTGATLMGDNSTTATHYWPTGINYRNEVSSATDLINHAKVVKAMIEDDCNLPTSW